MWPVHCFGCGKYTDLKYTDRSSLDIVSWVATERIIKYKIKELWWNNKYLLMQKKVKIKKQQGIRGTTKK